MADKTSIEWTRGADGSPGATWNPITGCSVVSPGCTNCYAMRLAGTRLAQHPSRAGLTRDTKAGPVWTGEVRLNEQWLDQPLRWKRPRMIFVCAHGDLFHPDVPFGWVMRVLTVMVQAPQHTYQILTKRADRMRDFFTRWADTTGEDFEPKMVRGPVATRKAHPSPRGQLFADMLETMGTPPPGAAFPTFDWAGGPLWWPDHFKHIWLGVSAEDQQRADERIPHLLATPAAVRWISAEPLLGPIDLRLTEGVHHHPDNDLSHPAVGAIVRAARKAAGTATIDWLVAGGESGPGARPMHPEWARGLRDQCAAAGVPFHFKQWGGWAPVCAMSDEQIDACYHPAPESAPEARRRARVAQLVLQRDGKRLRSADPGAYLQGTGAMLMFEVGKARAGRLLDGREHNGMP